MGSISCFPKIRGFHGTHANYNPRMMRKIELWHRVNVCLPLENYLLFLLLAVLEYISQHHRKITSKHNREWRISNNGDGRALLLVGWWFEYTTYTNTLSLFLPELLFAALHTTFYIVFGLHAGKVKKILCSGSIMVEFNNIFGFFFICFFAATSEVGKDLYIAHCGVRSIASVIRSL